MDNCLRRGARPPEARTEALRTHPTHVGRAIEGFPGKAGQGAAARVVPDRLALR